MSPIQHWSGGTGQRCDLRITPLVNALLPHPSMFGPFLGLILLGGVVFSSFYHLFSLLLPFSFKVSGFKTKGLGRWMGGKPSLGYLPRCISPQLGLQ